jgi:pimeloyl-ACP methyl ester carboxylesterase
MIELFATKSFNALSGAIAQTPEQFGWLLWQKKRFRDSLPQSQQPRFETVLGSLIADNFIRQPSSGPAFVQMASLFFEELARNTARLPELKKLEFPVKVIWGEFDPYITLEVAKDRVSHFKHGSLRVLPAEHWLQSDLPIRSQRRCFHHAQISEPSPRHDGERGTSAVPRDSPRCRGGCRCAVAHNALGSGTPVRPSRAECSLALAWSFLP